MKAHLSTSALVAAVFILGGCGGTSSTPAPDSGPADSGVDSGPVDSGPPDLDAGGCFTNPQTALEIINACTTATHYDKSPTLPLLLPDGGLPPLP
jgi:hypothetical protein